MTETWKCDNINKLFVREAFINSRRIDHKVELKNNSCLRFLHVLVN